MKKILFALGAAALSMAVVSCDKSGGNSDSANKPLGDSLSLVAGEYQGSAWAQNYLSIPEADRDHYAKDQIIRGVEQVIMTDTANMGYISGLNIGMQLAQQLMRYEQAGIPVDRRKFMAEFSKAFKADTVNEPALLMLQTKYQEINRRANDLAMAEMQRRADAEREARAKENAAAIEENRSLGEKLIKSVKAEDSSVKTTESGLTYKVVKAGNGPAVGKGGRATVKYTGKLADGTQFDSSESAVFTPSSVIPGFGEGLEMMQKGGHYVLYIPGEIAYGSDGIPGSIPPMSTLVFDVEVLDVQP